jgi:hypothetical protein
LRVIVVLAHGANVIPFHVHVLPFTTEGVTLEEKFVSSPGSISVIDHTAVSVPVFVIVIV